MPIKSTIFPHANGLLPEGAGRAFSTPDRMHIDLLRRDVRGAPK